MQFDIIEHTSPHKAVLHIKKTSIGFVNALRRAILSQLPNFAIDEVDLYENNSALFSEYIANRLGLLPLTYSDEVASDARISLTLNMQGPCTVYSKDIVSSEPRITPLNGDFPIAELQEDQRLRLEAWAVRGIGRTHAKFQCAHAAYQLYPDIELKKASPRVKEFLSQLPPHVLDEKGEIRPHYSDAVAWFIEQNPDLGTYTQKDDEFIFTIESYNGVPALTHLQTALTLIKDESTSFRKEL